MLRVAAIRWEAPGIRSIELRRPQGGALPAAEPGAHLDLALPGDLVRSYSLVNGPRDRDAWVIAVNREAESRGGSAYLCDRLRVGEMLEVRLPRNAFPLAPEGDSHLIAGGIGITPVLSMIRHLDAAGRGWRLTYAMRDRASAAFLDALAALDAGRGRVTYHVDAEAGGVLDMAGLLAGIAPDTHVYACGPGPMLDAFTAATAGRDPGFVHLERFAAAAPEGGAGFTVVLKRSGREFAVGPDQTILDVLEAEGVRVAHSCRTGVCGSCETRVIEGTPDHRDSVLSPREQASGKVIMPCCSRSLSARLVLDL